jgi:pyrroloquinoline quinone biosynthesis protein B
VLGSAAGGGVPQWNCGCAVCAAARRGDAAVPLRSQDSLAVSAEGQRWSILNASPDVRDQLARFPALQPRPGTRDIPLDTVVLTNPDLDHALGVLVMREALPHRVVTTPWVADVLLEHNAVFRRIEPAWGRVKLDEAFPLDRRGDLEARLFPVPGKVPSWCEGLAANHPEATVGVRITDLRSGRRTVYVPGARSLDAGTRAELEAAALRFLDGTFWSEDELRQVRPGAPEARAMGHLPIGGADGSLAFLAGLPGRSFYVHLNNTNPALVAGSPQAAELARRGVGVAHDGLELEA